MIMHSIGGNALNGKIIIICKHICSRDLDNEINDKLNIVPLIEIYY